MKHLFLVMILALLAPCAQAQPTKRRTTTSSAAAQAGNPAVKKATQTADRASLQFPTAEDMPDDVVWKRDIYRQLDLDLDANAPLYYPVEPQGTQCNLFTYLFRLMLTGRVPAYNYKLDGNESFTDADKITDVKELLDRYYIYYEEQNGHLTVADNDVPSAFVRRYYIKESSYLDQRTGTFSTRVTALCPIMLESDDFGDSSSPKPLFWMRYDDLAPYLSRLPIMASNLNNVTLMTADDYFQLGRYDGKIYKTANLQGRVLADYCKTPEEMEQEQQRIEQQLSDFESHVWTIPQPVDSLADSLALAQAATGQKHKRSSSTASSSSSSSKSSLSSSRRSSGSSSGSKQKKSSSGSKSTAVASARRTRR